MVAKKEGWLSKYFGLGRFTGPTIFWSIKTARKR